MTKQERHTNTHSSTVRWAKHGWRDNFANLYKKYQNCVEVYAEFKPDEKKISLLWQSRMMGALRNRLFFHGKRRKISFFLRSFQSIFGGRSCDDFLSNLKNSHESMGLYLSEYWSNEEKNFFPNSTSLSCTAQYDFYLLKTVPFLTDLNTSLVIRKIPCFLHKIKISTFTDIFLIFFRWWNVP